MLKKLALVFASLSLALCAAAATIDIAPINIPAGADSTDVNAALAAYFSNNGAPLNPTNQQVLDALRQKNIDFIKQITKEYRKAQLATGAADPGLN